MDWLAGSRMHFVEIVLLRGATIIPMYALGFAESAIYAYIILVYLYATYIHANLKFDIEALKPVIVTPRFHHWHHGLEKEAIDVNFAIHFRSSIGYSVLTICRKTPGPRGTGWAVTRCPPALLNSSCIRSKNGSKD